MSDLPDQSRITVRLSLGAVNKINELIEEGKFKNISEFIREAIESHLDELTSTGPSKKMTLRLPRNEVENIDVIVNKGMAVDGEDLIRTAVRDYIRDKIRELEKEQLGRAATNG
ncbi:MAG: ribbon-helix-helix domain-containing protein [Thermoplasmatales archaeon]|jgi:Arc/MetJ-type ribon-helix-helix transcriptional regulator|nr:ribbon-helix-helix domain-containing protein [Candidatus Thermoplasmatota archaeon]MCL6002921.1 ribbon-helix-helix domain-containing protein [Candidatus Thermoplasmatota archaeon]MDA8055943.1 ribbon-helix-helix domain-containing protein [Thermoplasmatales archaeon]